VFDYVDQFFVFYSTFDYKLYTIYVSESPDMYRFQIKKKDKNYPLSVHWTKTNVMLQRSVMITGKQFNILGKL